MVLGVKEENLIADFYRLRRSFHFDVDFVLVEGFEDAGGCVFVLLVDFINHSVGLEFGTLPLQ